MNFISKKIARLNCLEMRASLSQGALNEYSEIICNLLFTNFNLEEKKISLFLPIESKKEINTYMILEKALSLNTIVGIPRADFDKLELKHYVFEGSSQLEMSKYGIPEPKFGKVIKPISFDYVIVPLLGFDKKGFRIGYGKGFYDRFLLKCSSKTQFIGLSLFEPLDQILDVESNDIKLHVCITPKSIFRF